MMLMHGDKRQRGAAADDKDSTLRDGGHRDGGHREGGHPGHPHYYAHFGMHPGGSPFEPRKPPSMLLLMAEMRAVWELLGTTVCIPLLAQAPRGDGHPVLVLPGFLAGDGSTGLLRWFLQRQGYRPYSWDLGRNLGGVYRMRRNLRERLAAIHAETGQKVSLIGWSLGGVYARDLALSMTDHVRYVITMGSPFSGDVTANNAKRLYELLSGETIRTADPQDLAALRGPLPVPTSAIYSKLDGVVHWHSSMVEENETAENIEVLGASHMGLGVNAAVLWAVADRLAQADGEFRRFRRGGPFSLAYARPKMFD